jgi:hypothetical protein
MPPPKHIRMACEKCRLEDGNGYMFAVGVLSPPEPKE